jgi:anti-sigma factor RsiW
MITRDNYEEFFLLYVDNELSPAEREAVESFIEANPGLRDEWEAILQSRVSPDNCLAFGDKRSLMRSAAPATDNAAVNLSNYQEYLLSYLDDELDAAHSAQVEIFLRAHPAARRELDQLLLTVSTADASVRFQSRELLYRHADAEKTASRGRGARAFFIRPFLRIAAAAVVLAFVALFIFRSARRSGGIVLNPQKQIAGSSNSGKGPREQKDSGGKNNSAAVTNSTGQTLQRTQTVQTEPAPRSTDARASVQLASRRDPDSKTPDAGAIANDRDPDLHTGVPVDSSANLRLAAVSASPGRVRSSRGQNPGSGVEEIDTRDAPAIMTNMYASTALKNEAQLSSGGVYSLPEEDAPQKSRMRGLLRKVSRTFGKQVSKGEDDQRTISIGPFEFPVQ